MIIREITLDELLLHMNCDQKIKLLEGDQETFHRKDYKTIYKGTHNNFIIPEVGLYRKYKGKRVICVEAARRSFIVILIQF